MTVLNAERIRDPITSVAGARLDILEVLSEIESTNSYLLEQPSPAPGRFRVVLADHQTAGRGRQDRIWQSPPASGLCLSMAYTFGRVPDKLPSLTLALGIGVAEALERLGVGGISLKWPNDIIACDGKLGGILTEVQNGASDGVTVVAGIGLNVDLPDSMQLLEGPSWTNKIVDLKECTGNPPSREKLSVAVIESLIDCTIRFESDGFAPFQDSWERYDWLKGKQIVVDMPDGRCCGVADGVDYDGALSVRTGENRRRIITGTISLPDEQDNHA
jgi:BirA family biotin operon repressor/biotin-[acetyl-CoA-carboxylase] ligase